MRFQLSLAMTCASLLFTNTNASATPITFAFTAQLESPVSWLGNSNQVNGTFTINGDPIPDPHTGWVEQDGREVSLTLEIGGVQVSLPDSQANPSQYHFTMMPNALNPNGSRSPVVNIGVVRPHSSTESLLDFSMSFFVPPPFDDYSNLRNLDTSSLTATGTLFLNMEENPDNRYASIGKITSSYLVNTPEPNTLSIFVILGMGAAAASRRNARAKSRNSS